MSAVSAHARLGRRGAGRCGGRPCRPRRRGRMWSCTGRAAPGGTGRVRPRPRPGGGRVAGVGEDGQVDPAEVGTVAGFPHHHRHLREPAVGQPGRAVHDTLDPGTRWTPAAGMSAGLRRTSGSPRRRRVSRTSSTSSILPSSWSWPVSDESWRSRSCAARRRIWRRWTGCWPPAAAGRPSRPWTGHSAYGRPTIPLDQPHAAVLSMSRSAA